MFFFVDFFKCIRCIGDQGRLLVIGFAGGNIPKIPANIVLVKGFSVVGVRAGESMRRHPQLAMVCKVGIWFDIGRKCTRS
jgi:NADPH2:quinone reductase